MAFYNLQQIQTEVLNRLKTHNNLVSNERIRKWSNLAQDDVTMDFEPKHLMKEIEFNSVDGERFYYLGFDFLKVMSVVDVTGNEELFNMTDSDEEFIDPNRNDTASSPWAYVLRPLEWIKAQPLSASKVDIVSNNSGDTTQQIRIHGVVDGEDDTELLTLNGTTTVTGVKLFSEIYTVSKNDTTDGLITVNVNDASNTEIVTIPANMLARPYQKIMLYPEASSVRTYRARGCRRPRQMVYAQDFPDLNERFHELIILGAVIKGHYDLFRPQLAEQVRVKEYDPLRKKLKDQVGQTRAKYPRAMRGNLPSVGMSRRYYKSRLSWNMPDIIG